MEDKRKGQTPKKDIFLFIEKPQDLLEQRWTLRTRVSVYPSSTKVLGGPVSRETSSL